VRGSICGVAALFVGLSLTALGQDERNGDTNVPRAPKIVDHSVTPRLPSTATFKITRVTPQKDGDTTTQESIEMLAWDSQRRQVTSITEIPSSAEQTPLTHVTVLDRDAHTKSSWSVPGDQVTVMRLPEKESGNSLCAAKLALVGPRLEVPMPKARHERPVTQSLGKVVIDGVEARGSRTTITFPAGAMGNIEPLVRTTELWFAVDPGLDIIVRMMVDDPLSGKLTRELQDLDMNEPDPRVYLPPPGYQIVQRDYPKCPPSQIQGEKPPSGYIEQ